ncbi:MAG: histone deacetylase family protein [Immundisolibacteraceae bacterium]|nr:histone deacetylase family protein [Immundisolibacteraceae bacterium]
MSLAIINHPACALHEMGPQHPEQPARLDSVAKAINLLSIKPTHYTAPLASQAQLSLAHDPGYVSELFNHSPQQGYLQLDPDTRMNRHSLEAARAAAGAVIQGVDLVVTNQHRAAFCNVRPPGHHAEHGRSMGFCLFNNIAVAALWAIEHHQLERVAIVDFDVHHGNGTEDILGDHPAILFCSSFQHPFYPYSRADSQSPQIINLPLASHSDGATFRTAAKQHWFPALEQFRPELIMISAGFDAHQDDPLAQLNWCDEDYGWISAEICRIAERSTNGQSKVVSTLEGGYQLDALTSAVAAHLAELS